VNGPYSKNPITDTEDIGAFRIPSELDQLNKSVDSLAMVIDTLMSRLTPVMSENMNKTAPSEDPRAMDGNPSTVAMRILGVGHAVQNLEEVVTNILRRLEV